MMATHMVALPVVGRSIEEAKTHRTDFISGALNPSKDIVSCATSILLELDAGKDTTQKTYAMAFEIAKSLTESIQPFTQKMTELNEEYTRIHIFFVVLEKMTQWTNKAGHFICTNLLPLFKDVPVKPKRKNKILISCNSSNEDTITRHENTSPQTQQTRLDTRTKIVSEQSGRIAFRRQTQVAPPANWEELLETFTRKHPVPKRRHMKLLTKYSPTFVLSEHKEDALCVVERAVFTCAILAKQVIKEEEISRIKQWTDNVAKGRRHRWMGVTSRKQCAQECVVTLV